jgi:predicted kinase
VHLRSDILRKTHHGVDELARLPQSAYGAAQTAAVYADLAARATAALTAGRAVITDAVYATPDERTAIEAVARGLSVLFIGIWLEAPAKQIIGRVAGRRGDASDATPAVVEKQLAYDIGPLTWRKLDASPARETVAAAAMRLIADSQAKQA